MKKIVLFLSVIASLAFASVANAGSYHHRHHHHHHPTPTPPPVVVVPAPNGPNSVFVCVPGGTKPAVTSEDAAKSLVASGSVVEAQAVAGNVEGGNNVGAFHLVCGATGTNTGQSVDTGGFVYGVGYPAATANVGFYFIYS